MEFLVFQFVFFALICSLGTNKESLSHLSISSWAFLEIDQSPELSRLSSPSLSLALLQCPLLSPLGAQTGLGAWAARTLHHYIAFYCTCSIPCQQECISEPFISSWIFNGSCSSVTVKKTLFWCHCISLCRWSPGHPQHSGKCLCAKFTLITICDLCCAERYELANSLLIMFIHCFAYLLVFFCCSTQL